MKEPSSFEKPKQEESTEKPKIFTPNEKWVPELWTKAEGMAKKMFPNSPYSELFVKGVYDNLLKKIGDQENKAA